jgi:hypothetical protein
VLLQAKLCDGGCGRRAVAVGWPELCRGGGGVELCMSMEQESQGAQPSRDGFGKASPI